MASYHSPRVHIPEVEDVFEALSELELSQSTSVSTIPTVTPRINFTSAPGNVTRPNFSTPRRLNDVTSPRTFMSRNACNLISNLDQENSTVDEDRIASPLDTFRLKPISERLRTTAVSITESGEVRVELFKQRRNIDVLVETFSVSQDGKEITVTREGPDASQDISRSNQGRRRQFSLNNLPKKYFKKYEFSRRFVNLVKSKTPRIIMYTKQAKCMLMENFPDPTFMAKFYDGQTYISNWRGEKVVNEREGSILNISSPRIQQQFSQQTQQLIKYSKKCHKHCLQLEGLIRSTTTDRQEVEELFPVVIGRRKSQSDANNTTTANPVTPMSDILNISNTSTESNTSSDDSVSTIEETNAIRQTIIPNIGSATQLTGELWVEFKDGCHIGIKENDDIFNFIDTNSICHEYNRNGPLPYTVRCKLDSVPYVIDYLRNKPRRTSNNTRRHQ